MIDIDPKNLIDHAAIEAAQARLDEAAAKLEAAKAAVSQANIEVSQKWDASVREIAAGGDPLNGAEAHGAAVQRREFAAQMVQVAEKNLLDERAAFEQARIMAHVPVLKKARELRLVAAQGHDAARRAADAADAIAAEAARLMSVCHGAGLRHFSLVELGHGARSEAAEREFLESEAARCKAFWGADL